MKQEFPKSVYDKNAGGIIFQQDNDPKHTCKKAQEWFKTHGITLLPWTSQSSDLNPIEHLWYHLKRRLGGYEVPPNRVIQPWEHVEKEWNEIDGQVCQNIIESISRHVEAMIKAKVDIPSTD